MNNRPTPETDAAIVAAGGEWSYYLGKCSRKLERELAEARELLASEKITRDHIIQRGIEMQKERDEAREAWYEMQSSFERSRDEVEKLIRERDEAMEEIEALRHEYHGAKAMAGEFKDKIKSLTEAAVELLQKLASALVERDEAREHIERQKLEIVRLNGATNHAGGTPLKIALRERDEWAAMCGQYKQERDEAITRRMETIMQCELYEQERDEAREENAKLRDIVERAINYLNQSYRDGFADEASDLRYELKQLKGETK